MPAVHLFMLAGFATAPRFLDEALVYVRERVLWDTGAKEAAGTILFPYGDWSRNPVPQLREILHDIRLPAARFGRSVGGRVVLRSLQERMNNGDSAILIGHSGGGVAALHGAKLMADLHGEARILVIQIGCPKCPVPPEMRDRVGYFYAADGRGRWKDPVTRYGSWSGWKRSKSGLPVLIRNLYRPDVVRPLPVKGGHIDYFRSCLTAADGRSNLEIVADEIGRLLRERCGR